MFNLKSCFASIASLGLLAATASAANIVVNDFQPLPAGPTTPDVWYLNDMRGAGTATIQNLTGLGGNLENNQPLPTGAAKLTTGAAGGDKSEIATFANLGLASSVLNHIQLGYDFYKASGGDAAPAPSIKLIILNSATNSAGNDDYGMLVYEPYLNPLGPSPATNLWTSVSIDSNTGSGDLGSGGWWWTGGFNIPSSAGGPPNRSLAEWLAAFQTADGADFAGASVVGIAIGVGSNNLNQVGYVDNVHVQVTSTAPGGSVDKTYDFQAASSVPEGGSNLGMLAMGLAGIFGYRLFKSKSRRA